MTKFNSRREFLRHLGISAAAIPFALNLPSLCWGGQSNPKQRLIIMFSPNGIVPDTFWPDEVGDDFIFKESLTPLEGLRDQTLLLHGVCDKVRGDGDNHMRGIGCLLTGTELFPGNIQGGSDTPAGWASGLSIDQEIKNFLQANSETRTRFGSLEFGVMVPDHADTWTRMVYSGPNKPITPIDNPYQMFGKLYGRMKDQESLRSILDDLQDDFHKLSSAVSAPDRRLLDEHAAFVRDLEQELRSGDQNVGHALPQLEPGVKEENDNMPRLSKLQIDLMVNSFAANFARIATLQFTNSVGQAKMHWLGVDEGHHELSHHEDGKQESQDKLTRINRWYCEQLAYLARRLADTPEPGGDGSLLDHTLIVWTNELGKGNTHTLDNIPFVLVGGAPGFRMGRKLDFPLVPHNRLWLSVAHTFGHELKRFGNPDYCSSGPLTGLT
ncbi:MAG TPA: DUF1552 domain-containing protein [Pirellulales bacterium]|jgi:hypothetical protein|nr:DUF1552 domain-containing protein [Pirellulales bacterium]